MANKPELFGSWLREKRLARGYTLRKFAEQVGISPTYLSHVEQNIADPPTADRVKTMAVLLGENADEMIALAGRVPEDLPEIILRQPNEIPELLREASGLTGEQLRNLTEHIRKLKEPYCHDTINIPPRNRPSRPATGRGRAAGAAHPFPPRNHDMENPNIPIILHVSIGTYRDGKIVDYSTHGHCLILRPDEIQNHLDISPDNVVTIFGTAPTTGIKERKFEPAIQIRSGTGRSVKEVLQEALNPKSDQYTNLQPDDTIQVGDEIYGETDVGPIWYTVPHVLHGFHVNNSKIRRPTDMLRNPRLIKEYIGLLAKIEATVEYLRHEVDKQPRPSEGGALLKATTGRIEILRLVAADLESATRLLTEPTL